MAGEVTLPGTIELGTGPGLGPGLGPGEGMRIGPPSAVPIEGELTLPGVIGPGPGDGMRRGPPRAVPMAGELTLPGAPIGPGDGMSKAPGEPMRAGGGAFMFIMPTGSPRVAGEPIRAGAPPIAPGEGRRAGASIPAGVPGVPMRPGVPTRAGAGGPPIMYPAEGDMPAGDLGAGDRPAGDRADGVWDGAGDGVQRGCWYRFRGSISMSSVRGLALLLPSSIRRVLALSQVGISGRESSLNLLSLNLLAAGLDAGVSKRATCAPR